MHRAGKPTMAPWIRLGGFLSVTVQACGGTQTYEMQTIEYGAESIEWVSPPADGQLWGTKDVLVTDGTTWVLTSSEPFLHVFRDGARIGALGMSGPGPNEMRAPEALLVGSDTGGPVTVWDPGSERYLTYPSHSTSSSPTARAAARLGGLIRSDIARATFGDPYHIATGMGYIVAASYRDGVMGGGDLWRGQLHRFAGIGDSGEPWIDLVDLPGAAEATSRDAVLGPVPLWDGCPDGRIALMDPIAGMLYLVSSDWETRDSIPLAWPTRPLRHSERIGYLVAQFRHEIGDTDITEREILAQVTSLEREARQMFSVDAPLGVDLKCGAGRVWVQEFDGTVNPLGFGLAWRTISLNGQRASIRVTLPAGFTLHRIFGSKILGVVTDSLGLERIATISLPPALPSAPDAGSPLDSLVVEARTLRRESKEPESLLPAMNLLYEYLSLADLPGRSATQFDDKMILVRRANAIRTLALVHRDLEDYAAALAQQKTALLLVRETGLSWHTAVTLRDIGRTHEVAGNFEKALSAYGEASDYAEATEDVVLKEILRGKLIELQPGPEVAGSPSSEGPD